MKTVILKYFKILQLLLCYCFMHQATSNKAWIGFFNTNISSIFFFIHKLKSMKTAWEHVEIKSTYMARVLLCSCTKWSLGFSGWCLIQVKRTQSQVSRYGLNPSFILSLWEWIFTHFIICQVKIVSLTTLESNSTTSTLLNMPHELRYYHVWSTNGAGWVTLFITSVGLVFLSFLFYF